MSRMCAWGIGLGWAIAAYPMAVAQQPLPQAAGFGAVYSDFGLDNRTGAGLHLGVAVDTRSGWFYVTAARAQQSSPHRIFALDPAGSLRGVLAQPTLHGVSAFGMRDLEFDGESLIGGSEAGISVLGTDGVPRNQILAANGPQAIVQPITGPISAVLPVCRAIALDPHGNQGNGSLLVADFSSPIYEIDLQGNILATFPALGWSAYGLTLDPITGNVWVHAGPQGQIEELDRATMVPTGRKLAPVGSGAPGGLAIASPMAGHHEAWPNRAALVHLVQGAEDRIAVQRLHLFPGVHGWDELRLEGARSGGVWSPGITPFWRGDSLSFRVVDPLGLRSGQPVWFYFNVYQDAAINAATDLSSLFPGIGVLWEQRSLHALSTPSTPAYLLTAGAVGNQQSFVVPARLPMSELDLFRIQGLYFEPNSPQVGIASTNVVHWQARGGERGIVVAAEGLTSFHGGQGVPFWSVSSDASHGHGDITRVEFSTIGAAAPAALLRFDIDQDGMGDRFDGGNSPRSGQRGTYRNGSAVACGLDFAAPGVHVASFHLPGESAGVAFSSPPDAAGNCADLIFRFSGFVPGRRFEFDCDTDGGPPSGSDHAGLWIRVTTTQSGVLTGVLQVDPLRPFRSVVWFP